MAPPPKKTILKFVCKSSAFSCRIFACFKLKSRSLQFKEACAGGHQRGVLL